MKKYSSRLVQGTIIILIFLFFSALLGYLQKFVFARFLSVRDVGLFFSVLGFVNFFVFFRDFGLTESLIYFIPRYIVEKARVKFKSTMIFSLIVQFCFGVTFLILAIIFSDFLAANYFKDPSAKMLLIFLSIYFITDGFSEMLYKTFQGLQNMFYYQAMEFSFQVFAFLLFIAVIFLKMPVTLFGIAYLISSILTGIIFFIIFVKKFFPDFFSIKTKITKNLRKKLLDFSFPLMTGTFASEIFQQQTIFFLTYFVGLESVGYYVMATAIARISIYFSKASTEPFQPMISELKKRNKLNELNKYFNILLSYSYIIASPLILTLIIFPNETLTVLYGNKYLPAYSILKLESLYCIFYILNVLLKRVLSYTGNPKPARDVTYLTVISNLVFNIILIPTIGLTGAGIADLISVILALAYSLYLSKKIIGLTVPGGNFLKIFVACLAYVAAVFLLKSYIALPLLIKLIVILGSSGIVYLAFVFMLGLLKLKDLQNMFREIMAKFFPAKN